MCFTTDVLCGCVVMSISKIQLSQLLSAYGNLLTQKQQDVVAMYCDCTLSEIASEQGISRQGVRDAIVKAETTLVKLEETLGLAEFLRKMTAAMDKNDNELIVELAKQFVNKE